MLGAKGLLAIAISALLAYSSEAGCYRGRPKPVIPVEDYHWNDEPAPQLTSKHLPRRFDWSNVDGQSYLVTSWGQHQPIYCGSCWVHGTLSMVSPSQPIHWSTSPHCQSVPCILAISGDGVMLLHDRWCLCRSDLSRAAERYSGMDVYCSPGRLLIFRCKPQPAQYLVPPHPGSMSLLLIATRKAFAASGA